MVYNHTKSNGDHRRSKLWNVKLYTYKGHVFFEDEDTNVEPEECGRCGSYVNHCTNCGEDFDHVPDNQVEQCTEQKNTDNFRT